MIKRIRSSITGKLISLLVFMLALDVVPVVLVVSMVQEQRTDSVVINDTGKLRMLSQRMAKSAFMAVAGHPQAKRELTATADEFEALFQGIRFGNPERNIAPAPAALEDQLSTVSQVWVAYREEVQNFAQAADGSAMQQAALQHIIDTNLILLKEANTAVQQFEQRAQEKVSSLIELMFIILVANVAVFGFVAYRVVQAMRPLGTLNTAVASVAEGNLDTHVEIESQDEIGEVAEAFNVMVDRMNRKIMEAETMSHLVELVRDTGLEEALTTVIKGVREITQSQDAFICTYTMDEETGYFRIEGDPEPGSTTLEFLQHRAYREWLKRDEITYVEDLEAHLEEQGFSTEGIGKQSVMVSPLRASGHTVGGIVLFEAEEHDRGYTKQDLKFVENVSQLLSVLVFQHYKHLNDSETRQYLERETTRLVGAIEQVAVGNLTVDIGSGGHSAELARLKDALRQMLGNLRAIIAQVQQAAFTTVTTVTQMSGAAEEMAVGAQAQATQATEVFNAVGAMAESVQATEAAALETSAAAEQSGTAAQSGRQVVQQTIERIEALAGAVTSSASTVERLGDSSKQISEIVSVIDEIADQTNLLALNAAIEAARAGEQGRGFAVVADEVRKLAERTMKATRQIADTIGAIQSETEEAVAAMRASRSEVEAGLQLVGEAGQSLEAIETQTGRVLSRIQRISEATKEQSSVSAGISERVEAISAASFESAQQISEVARGAETLKGIADGLRDSVAQFQLAHEGAHEPSEAQGRYKRAA
ncbi:MAG: methyl-accepting chemotaxis protein [Bacteroidota bacterium]